MRKLFVVAGLVTVAAACVRPGSGPGSPAHPAHPAATIPQAITAASYPRQRDEFDAMPLSARGRGAFRTVLLDHLIKQSVAAFDRSQERVGVRAFLRAVTLFEPQEVYAGPGRHVGLAALAARVVATYSPRGDVARVALGLSVQISTGTNPAPLRAEFQRMNDWLDGATVQIHGPLTRGSRLIDLLEMTARAWPSPHVVQQLITLRKARMKLLSRAAKIHSNLRIQASYPELFRSGLGMVRIYLLVNQPALALRQINELPSRHSRDETLRSLLERTLSKTAVAGDYIDLARHFKRDQSQVAFTICRQARVRFPQQAAAHACTGRLARKIGRMLLAERCMAAAVRLEPRTRTYAESLAEVYRFNVVRLIVARRRIDAQAALGRARDFFRRASASYDLPLAPSDARFYFKAGDDFFDEGQLSLALAAFEASLAVQMTPETLVKVATIRMNRADGEGALRVLEGLEDRLRPPVYDRSSKQRWHARLQSLRARILQRAGQGARGRAAHQQALIAWQVILGADRTPQGQSDALMARAKSLFSIGQNTAALDAVRKALAVKPLRRGTYFDSIALLTTRGYLAQAVQAYHRLLEHPGVSEYQKSYCSFWVVGLARRTGQAPDPRALAFLGQLTGDAWYTRLARLVLGKVSYEQLLKEAKTVGNRAELHYYQADQLAAQGRAEAAQRLWRQVVKTEMMGFYEYEMARQRLADAAAATGGKPAAAKQNPR